MAGGGGAGKAAWVAQLRANGRKDEDAMVVAIGAWLMTAQRIRLRDRLRMSASRPQAPVGEHYSRVFPRADPIVPADAARSVKNDARVRDLHLGRCAQDVPALEGWEPRRTQRHHNPLLVPLVTGDRNRLSDLRMVVSGEVHPPSGARARTGADRSRILAARDRRSHQHARCQADDGGADDVINAGAVAFHRFG